ncbi:MAG TPA: GxxExxY protein [Terriglobales bacterium]|nr:GxxExxY protein [Terriglobales bacterium]
METPRFNREAYWVVLQHLQRTWTWVLESVYEQAFSVALAENNIFFQRQVALPVYFHGHQIGDFRADLFVDGRVIVELKAGRAIEPSWEKQVLNYLRATDVEVGLLFNFGAKAEFKRYVFDNLKQNRQVSASIRGEEVPGR